jgi:heme/copper-type cytochrome/quinol oxidase subunit 4
MEDEQLDQEEIWSAIRYLDPDERDKDREAKSATIIAVLAVLLTVCAVWVVLRLRVQGL